MNYLYDFLQHKLLICIKNATTDELKELDNIIHIDYCSGDKIYEKCTDLKDKERYLHCRVNTNNERGLTYSDGAYDVYHNYCKMPFVTIEEFLNDCNTIDISEEELSVLLM